MRRLNKYRIRQSFARASSTYTQQAEAQALISMRLAAMPAQHGYSVFKNVLEIGCGNGGLTLELQQRYHIDQWLLNDLNPEAPAQMLLQGNGHFQAADAETLTNLSTFDMLASASTVQWFTRPKRLIELAEQVLPSGGLLLFSTFLPNNLHEIRTLTGVGLDYPEATTWQTWLSPNFHLLSYSCDPITLSFPTPLAVLRHLQQTGVTATQHFVWTKQRLADFSQRYFDSFSLSDGVSLTYTPILFCAEKK